MFILLTSLATLIAAMFTVSVVTTVRELRSENAQARQEGHPALRN